MVGFISNLAPLLNYLRRRSPGPPFPPDHRQTGERGAINTSYAHRMTKLGMLVIYKGQAGDGWAVSVQAYG